MKADPKLSKSEAMNKVSNDPDTKHLHRAWREAVKAP
jgi:hypothetical protein